MKAKISMSTTIAIMIILSTIMVSFQVPVIPVKAQLPVPREESFILVTNVRLTMFSNFNPFIPNQNGQNMLTQLCFEPFMVPDEFPPHDTKYWLITGYNYSNNYMTFTMHIRNGVKWNDGVSLTSEDIKFTVELNVNRTIGPYAKFKRYGLVSIETPDPLTVVFNFNQSNPRIDEDFRNPVQPTIVPKHIWNDKDPLTFNNTVNGSIVTTGPYKLYMTFPDEGTVIWIRDDNYWGKTVLGFPGPKYFIVESVKSNDIVIAALENHEIDYINLPGIVAIEAAHAVDPYVSTHRSIHPVANGIMFNTLKYPLSLPEVRWAIAYMVNFPKMEQLSTLVEHNIAARLPWPQTWPGLRRWTYTDVIAQYSPYGKYNITKANEVLDNLGFTKGSDGIRVTPNGTRLSFEIFTTVGLENVYDILWMDLVALGPQVGIEFTTKYVASTITAQKVKMGDFDIYTDYIGGMWAGDIFPFLERLH